MSGGFVTGEGAAYSDFASLTDAGTTSNTFDYRLNEGTKASNYKVRKIPGTLEVEKAPLAAWLAMSSSRPVVVSLNSWISPEALEYPAPSCCSI